MSEIANDSGAGNAGSALSEKDGLAGSIRIPLSLGVGLLFAIVGYYWSNSRFQPSISLAFPTLSVIEGACLGIYVGLSALAYYDVIRRTNRSNPETGFNLDDIEKLILGLIASGSMMVIASAAAILLIRFPLFHLFCLLSIMGNFVITDYYIMCRCRPILDNLNSQMMVLNLEPDKKAAQITKVENARRAFKTLANEAERLLKESNWLSLFEFLVLLIVAWAINHYHSNLGIFDENIVVEAFACGAATLHIAHLSYDFFKRPIRLIS
jgi:hypothetical protein